MLITRATKNSVPIQLLHLNVLSFSVQQHLCQKFSATKLNFSYSHGNLRLTEILVQRQFPSWSMPTRCYLQKGPMGLTFSTATAIQRCFGICLFAANLEFVCEFVASVQVHCEHDLSLRFCLSPFFFLLGAAWVRSRAERPSVSYTKVTGKIARTGHIMQ